MQPISRTHVIITVLVIIAIGWLLIGRSKPMPEPVVTDPTTTPVTAIEWPSVEVNKEVISEENQYYSITAAYPTTRDARITDQFKIFAEAQIAQFKDDTSWVMDQTIDSAAASTLSFDLNYREEKSTKADTYVFGIVTYTGGAHGLQVTRTFAFDINGKAIAVTDLFTNGEAGIKTVAAFVQNELVKKNISDKDWIETGAGATLQNYQNFVISDAGITFIFDPYQVAPYASGTQTILVPLSAFRGIANPSLFTK